MEQERDRERQTKSTWWSEPEDHLSLLVVAIVVLGYQVLFGKVKRISRLLSSLGKYCSWCIFSCKCWCHSDYYWPTDDHDKQEVQKLNKDMDQIRSGQNESFHDSWNDFHQVCWILTQISFSCGIFMKLRENVPTELWQGKMVPFIWCLPRYRKFQ